MKGLEENPEDLMKLQSEAEKLLEDLGVQQDTPGNSDNGPCVLIVEDDEVSSLLLTKLVKKMGLRARCYERPLKALAEAKDFQVALLFLDIKLPEMNGLEFLVKLKEVQKNPDIPVVVVTGYTQKSVVDQIVRHNVQGILAKPVKIERAKQFIADFGERAKLTEAAT